jgi:hypothetical protein
VSVAASACVKVWTVVRRTGRWETRNEEQIAKRFVYTCKTLRRSNPERKHGQVRFDVLRAVKLSVLKVTVCWGAAPCSLVKTDGRFGGFYCLHCEVYFYEITCWCIP